MGKLNYELFYKIILHLWHEKDKLNN